jgi:aryl-alcohol dehydrogenase
MTASGICHTDLLIREGSFPTPNGARSNCADFFPRNFLAARADGTTALSRNGEPVHSHFFGQSSFATGAIVNECSVVPIADDIPFEVVAPFGCGVQTGVGSVVNALRPQAGSSIAIFGAGGLGLSAVMGAAISGCEPIIAVDLRPARLELARELGATHMVNAGEADPVEAIREITGAGTEEALDVNGLLSLGRIVRGVVEGHSVPQTFIPKLIDLWREGRLPIDRLVRVYDFDQINEAADAALAGDVVKPVLRMS